jgi:phosphoglycolate phosphatase-like HAD superfamily hydrolase
MRLVLFDIDGTLVLTAGAGMRAFYRAMHEVFDIPPQSLVIHPDGKTDPRIARECLAHFGELERWCSPAREALFAAYIEALEEEMEKARALGGLHILPGVTDLLMDLASRPDFALGLATGNLEPGARIKLGKAGLDRFFHFGGYGSDDENRTNLIRIAVERGIRFAAPAQIEKSFVIGDTPLDVIHGHAAGALVIAAASARYTQDDLAPYNPDLLVPDLTAFDRILTFLQS